MGGQPCELLELWQPGFSKRVCQIGESRRESLDMFRNAEHSHGVRGVGSSNLPVPTILVFLPDLRGFLFLRLKSPADPKHVAIRMAKVHLANVPRHIGGRKSDLQPGGDAVLVHLVHVVDPD
jgi:hypothetical protein